MFEDYLLTLWLIPGLPLLAAALTPLMYGPLRRFAHLPCILAAGGSCILSGFALLAIAPTSAPPASYTWFAIGEVNIQVALRMDGLTAVMLVTVTFVGTLIAVYAAGYMEGDEGYPRFFAEISLFLFSMTGLVMADNFLILYAFWEGVGLCSYLLIGFWFTKPAAAAAARKAFLVTRLGDVGFFLGILVIFAFFRWGPGEPHAGELMHTLDFRAVFSQAAFQDPGLLLLACLMLFCGAVGKSGQFPLHVWLPDAMEGPTPVSALIHAATMVTAGVYLVARCMPLFGNSPGAQLVVACVGGFTALLAALMALTQTDLKRVLAYSTVSQLGYMFLALGSGLKEEHLAPFAVTAAIFHLFTHAFFKALLFLSAGSVMHAMGNVIDMRRFGGLRRLLPVTHLTFLCGAAALAGVPLLSGFWSKDEILGVTLDASNTGAPGSWIYMVLFIVALVTAALTAFYTFRAYFLTFWGPERIPEEAGHHAHESPPVMTGPLVILALFAVAVGFVAGPLTHWFEHTLRDYWLHLPTMQVPAHGFQDLLPQVWPEHALNWPLLLGSSAFALAGIAVAWWLYVRQPDLPARLARAFPRAYELSRNRFYLDELYYAFIVRPMIGLALLCRIVDQYLVDGLVDSLGQLPRGLGYVFRPIQNGLVQFYALLMILGVAGFLLSVLLR
ncbi:MAG: NADH-quinone oxidoreductase subunit L [Gemmataceae bacterium]|nr:NADH-quinone oxidoreductase subunit L [Gemmataceae bacterium]